MTKREICERLINLRDDALQSIAAVKALANEADKGTGQEFKICLVAEEVHIANKPKEKTE